MPKQSAGILAYRRRGNATDVFLVHPGGPFWAKKDEGAWSIPKGEFEDPEAPLAAAKREFREETGSAIDGNFVALTPLHQPSRKLVHAFAVEAEIDPSTIRSNEFEMEWPRHSGKRALFPEVDRASWFRIDQARTRILTGQMPFLDELEKLLRS